MCMYVPYAAYSIWACVWFKFIELKWSEGSFIVFVLVVGSFSVIPFVEKVMIFSTGHRTSAHTYINTFSLMLEGQFWICIDFFMHFSRIPFCIDDFIWSAAMTWRYDYWFVQKNSMQNSNFGSLCEAVPKLPINKKWDQTKNKLFIYLATDIRSKVFRGRPSARFAYVTRWAVAEKWTNEISATFHTIVVDCYFRNHI